MINVDGSDFVKKGKHSVKVARQYCNSLGKVENCQTGVFDDYSSKHVYGLVNRTFYLPECWHTDDYAKLREQCEIPPGLEFKTKIELALKLINQIAITIKGQRKTPLYPLILIPASWRR